jgi:hypothetical protein
LSEEIDKEFYFLSLEWIEGVHPNFKDSGDISKVFTTLGIWAANCSKLIDENNFFTNFDSLDHFLHFNEMIDEHKVLIGNTVGNTLYEELQRLRLYSKLVIKNLKKMPNTLDPGDISLHNVIIQQKNGEVVFIDFESSSVRPMIMLFEHFGEGYESIPSTDDGITLALKSFFNAWNDHSQKKITWDEFLYSQLCAQIYYKVENYIYWLRRVLRGMKVDESVKWIKQDQKQLKDLLVKLEAGDVV